MTSDAGPLADLQVVDFSDAVGEGATRLLADLGATVLKVETAEGSPTREALPVVDGRSLTFAVVNAGKQGLTIDPASADDLALLDGTVGASDVVVLDARSARLLDPEDLLARHPHLVVVVSTPFGRTGPAAGWQATERTIAALTGSLSRSGRPGDVPLLPPAGLGDITASAHGAWLALTAYERRLQTGRGQVVDLSRQESTAVGLDPAYGVQGSAAAGRSGSFRRDRPPADSYPVYRCADGHVRLCLLAKRQWRGMFAWLGEPEEFADPRFDTISARVQAADRLEPLIAALFADVPGAELVAEAATRGIPLAQVLTPAEVLTADHFAASGALVDAPLDGLALRRPAPVLQVDGARSAPGAEAPRLGDRATGRSALPSRPVSATVEAPPLSGLRVLDLGVIVFGAEVGRALGDLGADVIKVESLAFPDGLRQTRGGEAMNASFAWGHRSQRSLGLDLRSDAGRALFVDLAAEADVVLSNFKPGTLDSLGIGPATLAERNQRIVVLESAAFGSVGPWSGRLGYGPLVRAACGISSLWKYDADDVECWDGVTVYPDHVAARVGALGVLACLIRRRSTGRGGRIELAQSDVVLHQLGPWLAAESVAPGGFAAVGNAGRDLLGGGVLPCAGDDEWVVVDVRDVKDRAAVEALTGSVGLVDRSAVDAALRRWTAERTPDEAMTALQEVGVPAGAMRRLSELKHDAQLLERGTYETLRHPLLDTELPTERVGSPYGEMPTPLPTPAPLVGEHTRDVLRDLLGLGPVAIDELLAAGVVHEVAR